MNKSAKQNEEKAFHVQEEASHQVEILPTLAYRGCGKGGYWGQGGHG